MSTYSVELDFVYEPRTPEDTLENQLGVYLFQNGWTHEMTATVVSESGPGGGHPVVRFETDDRETFEELRAVYGLDDDEPASHDEHTPIPTGLPGEYRCSGCGEDQTGPALAGLLSNANAGLSKAESARVAGTERLFYAGIVEAEIWLRHAATTAQLLINRQDEAEAEKVSRAGKG